MKHYNNNSGYSIVISLLMVGFLIVVTSWVFNLVLWELNDNRGRENYLKAFAAAEGAQELALLQIKKQWYGYYGDKATVTESDAISNLLAEDPLDIKPARDPIISYNLDSKTSSYSETLTPLQYAIVPLFVLDDSTPNSRPNFVESDWTNGALSFLLDTTSNELIWNLLSEDGGMSWVWGFSEIDKSTLSKASSVTPDYSVDDFIRDNVGKLNYLILFNSDPVNDIIYTLTSNREFTKPETTIISSAQVWKYKQNLSTTLNNTEFLNILRYSIYSN